MPTPNELRHPYKGHPARAWVRLRFKTFFGTDHEVDLVADTGSPFLVVVDPGTYLLLKHADRTDVMTNFGPMQAGLFRLDLPDLGLTQWIDGYACHLLATMVRNDCPDFSGLAGLPLLQMLEYGGNAHSFWIRGFPSP